MAINKITPEAIQAILRKTAYILPDNPSEQGMKAADIKKAFYQYISDASASICSEVNRIVEEANTDIASRDTIVDTHADSKENPHNVTKAQVGLGNADDTSDMDKPVSTAQAQAIQQVQTNLTTHEENVENPHNVTKEQLGIGNVDNTSDTDKPVSTAQQEALNLKIDKASIANDCDTDDETKVLSAKQGKELKNAIPSGYGKTIEAAYVAATGVLTIILKDENSNVLETASVDLPLELLLSSSGSYYENGVLYLKLANGNFINVDVSDLVHTYTADGQTISMDSSGVISISTTYKAKIDEAYNSKHSHSNRDLLETYNQTNENLSDAVGKRHSHSNKSVLDSITAAFTTAKDTALANSTRTMETITISVADWAGGTTVVKSSTVAKESNAIFYTPDESSYAEFTNAEVRLSAQGNGQLTIICSNTPQTEITLNIVALG